MKLCPNEILAPTNKNESTVITLPLGWKPEPTLDGLGMISERSWLAPGTADWTTLG